jgi:hypothetical protein
MSIGVAVAAIACIAVRIVVAIVAAPQPRHHAPLLQVRRQSSCFRRV